MAKKRMVTIILAMIMCISFSVQKVEAAKNCSHNISVRTRYEKLCDREHKVYRNLYVDGNQVYSICNVSVMKKFVTYYCTICHEISAERYVGTVETHSLANDPDHK